MKLLTQTICKHLEESFQFDPNSAYVFMGVSHHHMVVGHTLEESALNHHAGPLPGVRVSKFFWGVVTLDP